VDEGAGGVRYDASGHHRRPTMTGREKGTVAAALESSNSAEVGAIVGMLSSMLKPSTWSRNHGPSGGGGASGRRTAHPIYAMLIYVRLAEDTRVTVMETMALRTLGGRLLSALKALVVFLLILACVCVTDWNQWPWDVHFVGSSVVSTLSWLGALLRAWFV
jgi:hypothetical protein